MKFTQTERTSYGVPNTVTIRGDEDCNETTNVKVTYEPGQISEVSVDQFMRNDGSNHVHYDPEFPGMNERNNSRAYDTSNVNE